MRYLKQPFSGATVVHIFQLLASLGEDSTLNLVSGPNCVFGDNIAFVETEFQIEQGSKNFSPGGQDHLEFSNPWRIPRAT